LGLLCRQSYLGDGKPFYVHERFGLCSSPLADQIKNKKPRWEAIGNGFITDAQQAIFDASFEADIALAIKVIPVKAEIRIG